MGSFDGTRWRPYLDEEAQEIRDEKIDHLKRKYDGPSDFIKQKLKEEEVLSIEEKIQKFESEINEKKEDLEKLKQIKREREQQDKLRDKKELLKEKQKKLRKVQRESGLSREEIEQNLREEWEENRVPSHIDVDEYIQNNKEMFERRVENRLEKTEDVDELVEDVQRLQEQVADLNGGREEWFMNLESVEVNA